MAERQSGRPGGKGGRGAAFWVGLVCTGFAVGVIAAMVVQGRRGSGETSGVVSAADDAAKGERIDFVVSIPPLKGLVQELLPPGGTVESVIPVGVSEHGYEIPPSRLVSLVQADLVAYVGLGLEPRVVKFLADNPRPLRVAVEFAGAVGEQGGDHTHDHDHEGHDHEHHHGADPHLWLDPVKVERFVTAVRGGVEDVLLRRLDGEREASALASLHERYAAMSDRIRAVDARYRATLEKAQRRTIVVAHDAYSHMASRYGLNVVALAGLTASEPTPAAIERAISTIRAEGVTAVFAEPQLAKAAAERVAEQTGVELLMLDPLGDGDWFSLMHSNLEAIAKSLGVEPAPR